MPEPILGHIHRPETLEPVVSRCQQDYPHLKVGYDRVRAGRFGEGSGDEITAVHNGVRHLFILGGQGEIFLDISYRTQEGDGESLPDCYEPDVCDSENLPILQTLAENLDTLHSQIRPYVESILTRFNGNVLIGDISSEIRLMTETGLPLIEWSSRPKVRRAFEILQVNYSQLGWSTKKKATFEPFGAGDQLTVTVDEPIRVRGEFDYWWVENTELFMTHITVTRRLRYLRNMFHSGPILPTNFRRLPLTWYAHTEIDDEDDGVNSINSHLVHLTAATSQPHYHPSKAVGGGQAESQIYLILDPANVSATKGSVDLAGQSERMQIYPVLNNLSHCQELILKPGSVVYIPPDTGHCGIDMLANVIAIPGFKPHNQIPLT